MARLPRAFDPQALEQEYVTSDISIRALAARHSVSWSTVASWAKKEDWKGKRVAYKAALSKRGYEVMAAEIASQQGVIKEESVAVLRATLRAYAQLLRNGEIKVTPKDAIEAVRELRAATTEPDEVKEATVVTVGASADPDFFRRIVETARKRVATAGGVEGTSPPGPANARPN